MNGGVLKASEINNFKNLIKTKLKLSYLYNEKKI